MPSGHGGLWEPRDGERWNLTTRAALRSCKHAGIGWPARSIRTSKEYQERAAECLRLAQGMNDPAKTWVRLAEQAQREDRGKK
jgi:hypothetical protein